jgi:hypothetical protein
MHLGYWDVEVGKHAWGMIAVLIVVGLGFVALVLFSDQLQVLFVRLYGFLDSLGVLPVSSREEH